MGNLKWQTISKIAGGGSISVIFLLLMLLNLTGVSYEFDGDKTCTDCFSEIRINSTFWEVCVEHAGDKDVVFKKRTRSRRLWVNLDKVDNVVTTSPHKIDVEILVPTNKKYATYNNEEYGYLRPIKDGDCIIKRRTKSNPRASRIIIHPTKEMLQNTKWSFNLNHWLMKDIDIDPWWNSSWRKKTPIDFSKTVNDEDIGILYLDEFA